MLALTYWHTSKFSTVGNEDMPAYTALKDIVVLALPIVGAEYIRIRNRHDTLG